MTRRSSAVSAVVSLWLLWSSVAAAHHGTAGLFDLGLTAEVTGSVKKLSFVNPHPILVLEVIDEHGMTAEWDVYVGPSAASMLRNRGYDPDTFTFGETLTITGHTAKVAGVRGIDVFGANASVTRPDGTQVP